MDGVTFQNNTSDLSEINLGFSTLYLNNCNIEFPIENTFFINVDYQSSLNISNSVVQGGKFSSIMGLSSF